MDAMVIIWLSAVIIFAIVEAMTVQMLCIWFAAASLVSLILALLRAPEWVQIIVFCICTAILLIFTRPIVKRLMKKPETRTNADRILGMHAIVIHEINNDIAEGRIKVSGQVWTARSADGDVIPVDEKVIIRSIEGVKVIVEKLDSSAK